jgi:hypothetical protein
MTWYMLLQFCQMYAVLNSTVQMGMPATAAGSGSPYQVILPSNPTWLVHAASERHRPPARQGSMHTCCCWASAGKWVPWVVQA